MKNIFVPLTGCANDVTALEAARSVAASFQGRIQALHVYPDPLQIAAKVAVRQFVSRFGNIELIHALQKQADERRAAAVAAFAEFQKTNTQSDPSASIDASMLEWEGDPVPEIAAAARLHDLLVLARASEDGELSLDRTANVLVACGRPVLLLPHATEHALGTTIAIAWKDTAETARAITAAMPFLTRAQKLYVLHVPEEGKDTSSALQLAANLEIYGVPVEARQVQPDACSGSEALLATAYGLGADLLVMGAYSRSRFGELIFGGYTRDLLQACDIPVLMLH
jgi:nucleotide-binding universal stress UspA family protein